MSETLTPKLSSITADEISPDWIGSRRAMIKDQDAELRVNGLGIEAKIPSKRNDWQWLTLPNGGHEFATIEDRDAVMEQLGWKV